MYIILPNYQSKESESINKERSKIGIEKRITSSDVNIEQTHPPKK